MNPDPLVEVNPWMAVGFGIEDGDLVWLENNYGWCRMRVKISHVHPRAVVAQHSWRYPEKVRENDFCAYESNINVLIPGGLFSKSGFGGARAKSVLCRVVKDEVLDPLLEEWR